MQPEIHLGPVTLQTFGIMFALGFIAAGLLVARRLKELGKPVDWAYELVFAALVGGVVGSRLDFIIENYDEVSDDLVGNLFSGSGLIWYGGAIGGAIGVDPLGALAEAAQPHPARHLRARARDRLCDRADRLPALRRRRLRHPVGRALGDGLSGRHRADRRPGPPDPDLRDDRDGARRPTSLWRLRTRFQPGLLFALYLILAGVERFLIEFIRRNDDVALGLTQAQLLSVAMMLAGGIWFAVKARRNQVWAAPGAPPGHPEPEPSG